MLSDYDIEQLRGRALLSIVQIGARLEFFFACNVKGLDDGICAVKVRVLDIRPLRVRLDGLHVFVADLAVATDVPGFYTPLHNQEVAAITMSDEKSVDYALCLEKDFETVMKCMNEKYIPPKAAPTLRLVKNDHEA